MPTKAVVFPLPLGYKKGITQTGKHLVPGNGSAKSGKRRSEGWEVRKVICSDPFLDILVNIELKQIYLLTPFLALNNMI